MGRAIRLRDAGLDWRAVEDQVIVLDSTASTYLGVNRTGALLWRRIAGGTTRESLIELLKAEGVGPAAAVGDVDGFLTRLADLGLLAELQ